MSQLHIQYITFNINRVISNYYINNRVIFSVYAARRLWPKFAPPQKCKTRHRANTSMYSLTLCVRFLMPERHQREPAVQAAAVMLRTSTSAANHRRASHAHFPYTARNFENARRHPPVSGQQLAQTPPSRPFALCRHIAGWTQACN